MGFGGENVGVGGLDKGDKPKPWIDLTSNFSPLKTSVTDVSDSDCLTSERGSFHSSPLKPFPVGP